MTKIVILQQKASAFCKMVTRGGICHSRRECKIFGQRCKFLQKQRDLQYKLKYKVHFILILSLFARKKMSQIMHFCGVKFLARKSSSIKFWTNIMSGLYSNLSRLDYFPRLSYILPFRLHYVENWVQKKLRPLEMFSSDK